MEMSNGFDMRTMHTIATAMRTQPALEHKGESPLAENELNQSDVLLCLISFVFWLFSPISFIYCAWILYGLRNVQFFIRVSLQTV